jgi:hypothetical protein
MNWTHFLLWLAGIYCLYYLVLILIDAAGGKQSGALKLATNDLTFSEDIVPHEAEHLLTNEQVKSAAKAAPEIIASGGVLLKDVYSLARKEVIVYTRQVSF